MKRNPLQAGFTLGFIGGGQLARMSALQAFRFGMNIAVYATSSTTEPVEHMTPLVFRGGLDDVDKLTEFAKSCDVVTLENEFVDASVLTEVVQRSGTPIFPTAHSFALIGDKLTEKRTFQAAGIPVAPFEEIRKTADIIAFGEEFGWPFVLKSAKGGYDGYGNATTRNMEEATAGFDRLGGNSGQLIIAEAFVPFSMELAVMVARNKTGIKVYPCVESIQKDHICKEIIAPARIPKELQVQTQELAIAAVEAIDGIGVFGFEFFLTHDNQILLNESAPRPHNSGHYTIEGCITSQFENHVRAVSGLPLGSTEMLAPTAVMVNILGKRNGSAQVENAETLLSTTNAHLHVYGKGVSKLGRKMGHVTLLGIDTDDTFIKATSLENKIIL
jgi:5-(carboxyamino)imidazole ribonucleotide synthase